jgi:hypothetical protein
MAINWKRLGSGIAWVVFSPLALLMAMMSTVRSETTYKVQLVAFRMLDCLRDHRRHGQNCRGALGRTFTSDSVLGCFRCLRRAWPHLDGVLTSLRRGILRACDFRLDVPYRHTIPVLRQATPAGGRSLSCSRRL